MMLWYDRPAQDWEREALPIGNGALGAMVFGGVAQERLQLNEKTLWTGGPGGASTYRAGNWPPPGRPGVLAAIQARITAQGALPAEEVAEALGTPRHGYGAYQHLADLYLETTPPGPIRGYRRELDLTDGVARVRYTAGGVEFHREYLASYPGRVIAGRLEASAPGAVSVVLRLVPGPAGATVTVAGGQITIRGSLTDNGLRYEAQLRVYAVGGAVRDQPDRVQVSGADELVFVFAAGTDYAPDYPHYRGEHPHRSVRAALDTAGAYPRLRAAHVADYQALAGRVRLDLGAGCPALSTDRLLAGYPSGEPAPDRALEELHFAYGRYLLIASSRAGSLPANLQGVWNHSDDPPWSADYHLNINLQMCYWPAELTHLAETAAPLHDFIEALQAPGRVTAREMFGAAGWVVHDETTPYGYTGVHDWPTAFWFPEAAAWLCRHVWEHYLFTGDREFLARRAWPVLAEAAQFWLANLVPDPRDGALVVSPSYSPEHGPYTAGAAMSQQIVWDLFTNTLAAAAVLGRQPPPGLAAAHARLDPGLRIGRWGQLQEWKDDRDDPGDQHRHASHLYALHPGAQLDPLAAPALAQAAAVSLRARGDGGTGWSKAWKISFWARLRDGDAGHQRLADLLHHSTLPNLWDTHPPYQLDGNLGAVAGVAELLLQSHLGVVDILPALPAAWPAGQVSGLRARGALTVDIQWRDGAAYAVTLTADQPGPVTVRCPSLAGAPLRDHRTGELAAGYAAEPDGWRFTAEPGHRYTATRPE